MVESNGTKSKGARPNGARPNGANGHHAIGHDAAPGAMEQPAAAFDPSLMTLPYLEVSRALLRAHHNAMAMMAANRTLADSLRAIVRRQQDLAFEIAEQAMAATEFGDGKEDGLDRAAVFHRAADAVRELGEAMISAQLNALDTLRDKARAIDIPHAAQ